MAAMRDLGAAAREGQRARRRLRARPSRSAPPARASSSRCCGHGEVRREQGRGRAVHRRRRGDGGCGRAHRVRTIHTEIGIGAPAAKVWDVLIATDTWPQWNPFAKASGRFAVGERVAVTLTPPGKSAVTMPTRSSSSLTRAVSCRWLGSPRHPWPVRWRAWFSRRARGCRPLPLRAVRNLHRPAGRAHHVDGRRGHTPGFEAMNRALKARAEST